MKLRLPVLLVTTLLQTMNLVAETVIFYPTPDEALNTTIIKLDELKAGDNVVIEAGRTGEFLLYNIAPAGMGTLTLNGGVTRVGGDQPGGNPSANLDAFSSITVRGNSKNTFTYAETNVGYYPKSVREGSLILSGRWGEKSYAVDTLINLETGTLEFWSAYSIKEFTVKHVNLSSGESYLQVSPAGSDEIHIKELTRERCATLNVNTHWGNLKDDALITIDNLDNMNGDKGIVGGWLTGWASANEGGNLLFVQKQADGTLNVLKGADYGEERKTYHQDKGPNAAKEGDGNLDWYNDQENGGDKTITGRLILNSMMADKNLLMKDDAVMTLKSGGLILNKTDIQIASQDKNKTNAEITSGLASGELFVYVGQGGADATAEMKAVFADKGSTAVTLIKGGRGTLKLSNVSTYTGDTIINEGTLDLNVYANSPDTAAIRGVVTAQPGATLKLSARDALGFQDGRCVTQVILNDARLLGSGDVRQVLTGKEIVMTGGIMETEGEGTYFELWQGGGYGASEKRTTFETKAAQNSSIIRGKDIVIDQDNTVFIVADGAAENDLIVEAAFKNVSYRSEVNMTKKGSGTLLFAVDNAYVGETIIQEGTLKVGEGTIKALGTGAVIIQGGTLDAQHQSLANSSILIDNKGTLKNIDVTADKDVSLVTTAKDSWSSIHFDHATISFSRENSVFLDVKNQLNVFNNSKLTLGAKGSNEAFNAVLTYDHIVKDGQKGEAFIKVDSSSTLTLDGGLNFDLSSVLTLDWENPNITFRFVEMSDGSDYATWAATNLDVSGLGDFVLTPSYMDPNHRIIRWKPQNIEDSRNELMNFGTMTFEAIESTLTYVGDGMPNYVYDREAQMYGANQEGVNFTGKFSFADGVTPIYGFVVSNFNDIVAYSFSVSSQLTDTPGGEKAAVDIIGNLSDPEGRRTVTFKNKDNSFTGDVFIAGATLRTSVDNATDGEMNVLGKNNSVWLREGALLELATGMGSYVYSNGLTFAATGTSVVNESGTNELTGAINMRTEGSVTLENRSSGSLILSGTITDALKGGSMEIKSGSVAGEVIFAGGGSTLSSLDVNGKWALQGNTTKQASLALDSLVLSSGQVRIAQGTLSIGKGGITLSGAATRFLLEGGAIVEAHAAWSVSDKVSWELVSGHSAFNTNQWDISLHGKIGGTGTFEKKGTGALSLTGTSDLKGEFRVSQGKLILTNTADVVAKNVHVGLSAELHIQGKLTADTITMGSNSIFSGVSQDNSFDISFDKGAYLQGMLLEHEGNVVFGPESQFKTKVDYPNSVYDGIVMTKKGSGSTIDLQGLTIHGSAIDDRDWEVLETVTFTLMYADGGFIGDSVKLASERWNNFLDGELVFDGNNLNVELTRNAETIVPYTQTSNQYNTAEVMDVIVNSMGSLKLAGTELGAIANYFALMDLSKEAAPTLDMIAGLSNYQLMTGNRFDLLRHGEAVRQRAFQSKGILSAHSEPRYDFWVEGTQSYSRQDSSTNAPGYTHESWGGAMGADVYAQKDFVLGVAFAYSNVTMNSDLYAGKTTTDAYYIDLYGRWDKGPWITTFVLTSGMTSSNIQRGMSVLEDVGGMARSSSEGNSLMGQVEVGYDIPIDEYGQSFMPLVSLTMGTLSSDAYTETGLGNAGLIVDPKDMSVAQLAVGFRYINQEIDHYMECEESRLELRALIVHEFGDNSAINNNKFIGAQSLPFRTNGVELKRTSFVVGLGFSQAINPEWAFFGDLNGEFREKNCGMNASLGLRVTF